MRKEDLAVIEDALNSTLHLISNEMQCVIDDELSNEYQQVIFLSLSRRLTNHA